MLAIRTNLSLNRECTWDDVRLKMRDKKNAIAICPLAVDSSEQLAQVSALLRDKPNDIKCITVLVSVEATVNDQQLNAQIEQLASATGSVKVCSKESHPSIPLLFETVINTFLNFTVPRRDGQQKHEKKGKDSSDSDKKKKKDKKEKYKIGKIVESKDKDKDKKKSGKKSSRDSDEGIRAAKAGLCACGICCALCIGIPLLIIIIVIIIIVFVANNAKDDAEDIIVKSGASIQTMKPPPSFCAIEERADMTCADKGDCKGNRMCIAGYCTG